MLDAYPGAFTLSSLGDAGRHVCSTMVGRELSLQGVPVLMLISPSHLMDRRQGKAQGNVVGTLCCL